jgi:hypothetical protein
MFLASGPLAVVIVTLNGPLRIDVKHGWLWIPLFCSFQGAFELDLQVTNWLQVGF